MARKTVEPADDAQPIAALDTPPESAVVEPNEDSQTQPVEEPESAAAQTVTAQVDGGEVALDEAVSDEAALDEAALDEAVSDEAALDEAALDEAALGEVVPDEPAPYEPALEESAVDESDVAAELVEADSEPTAKTVAEPDPNLLEPLNGGDEETHPSTVADPTEDLAEDQLSTVEDSAEDLAEDPADVSTHPVPVVEPDRFADEDLTDDDAFGDTSSTGGVSPAHIPFVVPSNSRYAFADPELYAAAQPPLSARSVILAVSMLLTAALVALLVIWPVPYIVDSPGPTANVLGEVEGQALVSVKDAPVYPSTGELRLVTVSELGGEGYPATAVEVLRGWFASPDLVYPRPETTEADTKEASDAARSQQMSSSQELAVVAALGELGYEVPATLTVAEIGEGLGADGVLRVGDVITGLDGVEVSLYGELLGRLQAKAPGDTAVVSVLRGAAALDLPVVTTERPGGGALLGVAIDTSYDVPVEVTFNLEGIGGPSAGTMFALGIVDLLTPQDETGGQVIAGTGTIADDGTVGAIGGIAQKMEGAHRDGADWFLAPASNCDEVVGAVPEGMQVVAVSTLHEALTAVQTIGAGDGGSLAGCPAP